jgi:hypothetical protein
MNDINQNLIDPTCIDTTKYPNRSSYPIGSSQHLDPNYNILPFLCDLLNMATDPNATGLLTDPITPFDITPFTDFNPLTAIGDPRVSLGETMTQTFIHFLPRMITQTEVRQNGGSQVIDNYICTADGTPIKLSETVNALLSLDLTGQKAYQYGAITIPPITQTMEELMKPIDAPEVINFVKTYVSNAKDASAENFVAFIKKYFPSYSTLVDAYQTPLCLIVTLSNNIDTIYLKYYVDVAVKVGCLLNGSINQHSTMSNIPNQAMSRAMGSVIPNYTTFLTDKVSADNYYTFIINNFVKRSTDIDYSTMFKDLTGNMNTIRSTINSITANYVKQNYTTIQC